MKYYKLLKDLPTFKAGDEFYLDKEGNLRFEENVNIVAYHHSTLESFPNALKDWFEEIYVIKRWRAKYGEKYWYVGDNGGIYLTTEEGHKADNYRFGFGNYFKTAGEAYAYRKYLLARQTLLDDAKNEKYNANKDYYYTYFDYELNGWEIISETNKCLTPNMIYFYFYEDLQKSLEIYKEEWEVVRKYEIGGTQLKEVY